MDGMGKYHKLQLQRSVQTPIDFWQTGPAVGSGPVVPDRITSSRSSKRRNFWGGETGVVSHGTHLGKQLSLKPWMFMIWSVDMYLYIYIHIYIFIHIYIYIIHQCMSMWWQRKKSPPNLGDDSHFDDHIFQLSWNHQLEKGGVVVCLFVSTSLKTNGWNLKIFLLEKAKHRPKPPIYNSSRWVFGGVEKLEMFHDFSNFGKVFLELFRCWGQVLLKLIFCTWK